MSEFKRFGWDEQTVRVNPSLYLYGELRDPEDYIEDLQFIRSLEPGEVCDIYCNSPGGRVDTGLAIAFAMEASGAQFRFHVDSECSSAATFIMLKCHEWVIPSHARIFIHNYQGGTAGSGYEQMRQVEFDRKWSVELLRDVYKHFLTEDEIDKVLNNDVIYISGRDCVVRLNHMVAQQMEESEEVESD